MQNSQINRVVRLVRRTGDKAIIMDNESDAVMMLMELGAYEKILDNSRGVEKLTEEELMERINRDVAIWRAYNDKERIETFDKVLEKPVATQPVEPSRAQAPSMVEPELAKTTVKEVVPPTPEYSRYAGTEESASDIVAEEGEEKFYLEPVE